jgi:small-conductance mechanosensitive channel
MSCKSAAMKTFISYLFFFLFSGFTVSYAQTDSIQWKKDSVNNAQLNRQLVSTQQLAVARRSDSLKRADLQMQVSQLTAGDNAKRNILLKELNQLKERDSLQVARQKQQVDSLRRIVKGYPVVPFRDTLFYIYNHQGSFGAKERAEAISSRISKLSGDYLFKKDSLKLSPSEQTVDIVYKDNLLISFSERDALWENTTQRLLAEKTKSIIGDAIIKHRLETSWLTLVKESALALLVIVMLIGIIYCINKLFKWLRTKAAHQTSWFNKGIRIKNYELLNPEMQLKAINFVSGIVRWLAILLFIYLALLLLFGIFPFTKDISTILLTYITTPLKSIGLSIWNYIPNLITVLVLMIVFRYVLRFFNYIKEEIQAGKLTIPGFYSDWANPTYQIIRVLILAFMLIVIFPYLPGSDSQVFKGVSVFVGVLFTFGSAGALGNIVSGLVLTYMRAFKLGDRVKIGEVTGDIIGKTLLVTRIRTIQNEIISIPNSTVMSNHTMNYSSDAPVNGLIVHTSVTIGYDSPWRQVHELLIAAALETPMLETDPKPYVYQTSLDDYYVSYRINAFTKEPNKQAAIYSHFHENIQDQFNKAGVEIMSPHYKSLRDGNATTIPQEYLPKDYVPPAFNTRQNK